MQPHLGPETEEESYEEIQAMERITRLLLRIKGTLDGDEAEGPVPIVWDMPATLYRPE